MVLATIAETPGCNHRNAGGGADGQDSMQPGQPRPAFGQVESGGGDEDLQGEAAEVKVHGCEKHGQRREVARRDAEPGQQQPHGADRQEQVGGEQAHVRSMAAWHVRRPLRTTDRDHRGHDQAAGSESAGERANRKEERGEHHRGRDGLGAPCRAVKASARVGPGLEQDREQKQSERRRNERHEDEDVLDRAERRR
jgi:hypothetical protein